ncbi:MAG: hypothetical protein EB830_01400 [Nitrosopumilus sp. H13]|nr:MAG: hypothetical protein EB830_01400 [Nitrosopumilus sp. H13]
MYDAPVSRFWACFFSHSILALVWTIKMKKVQKWILVTALAVGAEFGGLGIYFLISWLFDGIGMSAAAIIYGNISVSMGVSAGIILPIYFMHTWTTEYNMDNFGCKSRKEWKTGHDSKDALG